MYNITFTLGDPGGDGHASTSEYHMVSNYHGQEIDDAYKKACEIIGFDYIKNIGVEYQDSSIDEKYFNILVEKKVIDRKDFEYESEGKTYLSLYLDEQWYLYIFINICRLVLPDLILDFRDLEEEQLYCLNGAAYGIAYYGG